MMKQDARSASEPGKPARSSLVGGVMHAQERAAWGVAQRAFVALRGIAGAMLVEVEQK